MNGENPIYEIYVMAEPWHLDKHGFPACGVRERVGFYYEKETAIKAVEENWCDIQDHYAHAAEIKPIMPGLYSCPPQSVCLYYEWNPEKECFERAPWPDLGEWDSEFDK